MGAPSAKRPGTELMPFAAGRVTPTSVLEGAAFVEAPAPALELLALS